MEHQHSRGAPRNFVNVVDPDIADLLVMRLDRISEKVPELFIRGVQYFICEVLIMSGRVRSTTLPGPLRPGTAMRRREFVATGYLE